MTVQDFHAGEDHPWRAETALQPVTFPERLLDRVQFAIAGQALDRGDFGTVRLNRQHRAGFDGFAVEQHGAGAAQGGFTSDVGSSQLALVPQEMDQEGAGFDLVLLDRAIDLE